MSSQTEIANYALVKVGANKITDINDSNSTEAVTVKTIYNQVRQSLLRSANWSFARIRSSLAQLETAPAFEFSFAYQLPSDFIKLVQVYNPCSNWKKLSGQLHSDDTTMNIEYIADITDENDFDPLFEECVALKIATEICFKFSSNATLESTLRQQLEMKLREAKTINAKENSYRQLPDGSWVNSRLI